MSTDPAVELHTSERSCFRRCPQKWWWKYRMGLVAKGEQQDALWFGIGVHIALAEWYLPGLKRGPHPADTFNKWIAGEERHIYAAYRDHDREWEDGERAHFEDAHDLGESMLQGYVERYARDPSWHVIAIEQPFKVNLVSQGTYAFTFASTFDGVYRDLSDGQVYLMEHKTAQSIDTAYLSLDDQAGAYWAIASQVLRKKGTLKPGERIAGIMYNFLRKSMPDERPENEDGLKLNQNGSISKRQPPARYLRELVERGAPEHEVQMRRMMDEVELMGAVRNGNVPLIKNTQRDCARFCEFYTMCTLHERGGDAWQTVMRSDFTQQNPYADRRKSSGA